MTMTVICDICGGTLMMDADGQYATCQSCSMTHSIERVREKVQESASVVLPVEHDTTLTKTKKNVLESDAFQMSAFYVRSIWGKCKYTYRF